MELKATITAKGAIFDGKAPEIIQKDLKAAMYEAVNLLVGKVKDKTPQGVFGIQGGLRSKIYGEVIHRGVSMPKGIVGHQQSQYGDVIEYGRRPGQKMPKEGVLLEWIEKKMHISNKEAQRIEFVVRRKIGKEGFEGVHMFEKAWNENFGKIQEIFDRAGYDIATHLNEGAV